MLTPLGSPCIPGCLSIEPWGAAIIGALSAVVYSLLSRLLIKLKVDDPVGMLRRPFSRAPRCCAASFLLVWASTFLQTSFAIECAHSVAGPSAACLTPASTSCPHCRRGGLPCRRRGNRHSCRVLLGQRSRSQGRLYGWDVVPVLHLFAHTNTASAISDFQARIARSGLRSPNMWACLPW